MKEKTKDAAHPRRHTQLAEFIDSESSSTLMGGDKQLSEFINSESHSQRGGDRHLSQFINSESASCAKNVAEVVNKERGKEKENLPPTPPIREKENRTRTRTGSGTGTDARGGTGTVGFRQMKGSGTVRIGRDFFFDPRFDPVQVALVGLGIPTSGPGLNGRQYNNAHIMRWYVREFGEDSFRQLAYQQWRENVIDGEPRSRAAVFMAKLWKVRNGGAA